MENDRERSFGVLLLHSHHILKKYNMSNVETWPQISWPQISFLDN